MECGAVGGFSSVGHLRMNGSMCVSVGTDANPNQTKRMWSTAWESSYFVPLAPPTSQVQPVALTTRSCKKKQQSSTVYLHIVILILSTLSELRV